MPAQVALAALTIICLVTQVRQARYATGRLASDDRNPYAYVPTRRDVEAMEEWLEKIRDRSPAGMVDGVAVIGSYYWPLPWYLRGFEKIGYWKEPPPDLEKFPLVCAMPEFSEAVSESLGDTHVPVPRGLRAGVPLYLFVRKDVWQHWLESESP